MKKTMVATLVGILLVLAFGAPSTASPVVNPGQSGSAKWSITASPGGQYLAVHPDAGSITCVGRANNPHTSTHAPGTVNAEDTITCTGAVTELSGTMELYRGSTGVAFGSGQNFGKSLISWNAAETCHKATYHSDGYGYITFPPGYVPQYDSHHLVSNYIAITTC